MKIKYKFVDGTEAEIEVEDSIGTVIKESRRLEGNLARKGYRHRQGKRHGAGQR